MAEGKAIDKANLELALSENNKRALEYIDAADNKIRRQLNRSNFIFVDDYDPCNGIIAEGLTYYIDFLDSYRSPDVSYVHNVINNEQYAQNNGVFINNKKGVFGGSQYLHAQDIKVQYPVTLEFLLQFDSSKNQIVFFENYSPRIVCGYWNTYFVGRYKGDKTFPYDFSELTNKVNLLTICYENEDAMTIYVNGVKLEEQDKTSSWNTSTFTGTYIGRRSYKDSDKFQGNMYRIRIYDRILTQEEILLNYTADTEFINSSVEYGKQYNLNILGYENEVIGIEDTPVGHIISHMGTTAPKHYLICNGSEYNITDYPYLSQYIEDEYGAVNYFGGDGINTFCVPQVTENMRVNTNADIDLGNKKIITVKFAELSGYDDVVHVPNMTITENENESTYYFLKQTDNKYLVLKKFNAKVIGLVNSFKTAGGSKSRGEFRQYRNNTLVQNISYQAPDKTVGSQGTAEGMFSFEEGDVFYFYTPATDGYPQQYGTIIIEDNTVNSISCIKYEPTYYMNVTQTISLEEANELKEQNQLLKKQNQLLQQEIEALNVIIDSNKTTI